MHKERNKARELSLAFFYLNRRDYRLIWMKMLHERRIHIMSEEKSQVISYLREDIKEVKRDLTAEINDLKTIISDSSTKTEQAVSSIMTVLNEHDKRISFLERAEQARTESEARLFSWKQGVILAAIALAPFFWEIVSKFF